MCFRTLILMHVIYPPFVLVTWRSTPAASRISTLVGAALTVRLFDLLRLCDRESVGFAADRSFLTALEHCIQRSLSACNRFRFVIQLAIATYDLGLRLGSGLRFRAFSVSLSFECRLSSTSSTCFPVASELALSACTYGLRFGDRFRLHFLSALRFRVISFARGCCVSACGQSDSTLLFSSAWLTCVKSLRYGCLSLSITSVALQADSMLTARIWHSMFDCDSSISPSTLRLPFG
jgi:hypothetical protein